MADLFRKQADEYAGARPSYPPNLFAFITSKTPQHLLAWDVATGNGQAAIHLARMYKEVVATDSSPEQLSLAPKLPNVRYVHTPPAISLEELQRHVAPAASLDLVTVAQALHWFHLPAFYDQASRLLRPGRGVFAAWCYTDPRVNAAVDAVFRRLYHEVAAPFWAPQRRIVDDEYRSIDFPFDPVEGEEGTGPFEFSTEREMDLEAFLTYLRSWSAYQTAKGKGVELLSEEMVEDFRKAWGGEGKPVKLVRYPVFLRIGKDLPPPIAYSVGWTRPTIFSRHMIIVIDEITCILVQPIAVALPSTGFSVDFGAWWTRSWNSFYGP